MKRSLTILAMLALGMFLFACEVEDDATDAVDDTTAGEVAADVDDDPCLTATCSADCAEAGDFDADCLPVEENCKDTIAQVILTDWANGMYAEDLNLDDLKCDYNENICEAQFKCSDAHCFCDIDCYMKDADGNWEAPPVCAEDGHCDSWCPTDSDPDCEAGDAKNGKYCG
jgi:hypothetical protein